MRHRGLVSLCMLVPACLFKPDPGSSVSAPGAYDKIVIGARHVCALDGAALYCWGDNHQGQIGVQNAGSMTHDVVMSPLRVGADKSWTAVSAGALHSCAIHDGIVECWGDDDFGQVLGGQGGAVPVPTQPTFMGTPPLFDRISAGAEHSCAISVDNQLWCWGGPTQLGRASSVAIQIDARADWREVASGTAHTCGIAGDEVQCFGDNANYESGQASTADVTTPTKVPGLPALSPVHVAVGASISCAIMGTAEGGELWCWGVNGQAVISPTIAAKLTATRVGSAVDWTDIALGDGIACGVRKGLGKGVAHCWGTTKHGMFGDGIWTHYANDIAHAGEVLPSPIVDTVDGVELGVSPRTFTPTNDMACLQTGRTVACWGDSGEGEMGLGTRTRVATPIPISAPSGEQWLHIWAGFFHTCGLTETGLHCWGRNGLGQIDGLIGYGDDTPCSPPDHCDVPLPTLAPVVNASSVVAGWDYTCALAGNAVSCWGSDNFGQLGKPFPTGHSVREIAGTYDALFGGPRATCARSTNVTSCWGRVITTVYPEPQPQPMLAGLTQVGLGDEVVCGVDAMARRVCLGTNKNGEVGDGTLTPALAPKITDSNVTVLDMFHGHGCEILDDRTVKCWGFNMSLETGQATHPAPTPMLVRNAAGVLGGCTKLALGDNYSCAICGGVPNCWGDNSDNQLGRGDTPGDRMLAAPVAVPAGKTFVEMATGSWHACALTDNHELYCWGRSDHGQLGDGSRAVNLPQAIGAPAN